MDDCVHTYNNNNMHLTLKLNYTSIGVFFYLIPHILICTPNISLQASHVILIHNLLIQV